MVFQRVITSPDRSVSPLSITTGSPTVNWLSVRVPVLSEQRISIAFKVMCERCGVKEVTVVYLRVLQLPANGLQWLVS